MKSRLTRLRRAMQERDLDAMFVSSLPHVRYLTGFSGSNGLCLVTQDEIVLATDSRYALQSKKEARRCRRIISSLGLFESVASDGILKRRATVGFESQAISVAQFRAMKKLFPQHRFVGITDVVEDVALIKDPAEIESLRLAGQITGQVFIDVVSLIRPGVREIEIAAEISYLQRCYGGEGDAFEPIVASGDSSVAPHAHPTQKKIRRGELVILDFGTTVNGYCSDMTRTVAVGKVSRSASELYALVSDAHGAAIGEARGGISARDLDAVARERLRLKGFGQYFIHSLGHGIGLSIHERPRVSPLSSELLQAGSVITIEPGLYVPGVGGVRIEDDVVLTRTGCVLLTNAPRELMIV